MSRIVTVTLNPALDKSCDVDQVVPERKLRCGPPRFHPGGGGINVARAITKLGGRATAYWTCGGAIGAMLDGLLNSEGIDHSPLPIADMTRENLVVLETQSGQQYRFGMPGATLTNDEFTVCRDKLRRLDPAPEYVVLSGSLPPGLGDDAYRRLAEALPSTSRVILDASGPSLTAGIGPAVYLIKPNLNELGQLAGREIQADAQIREVARELIRQEKTRVVVTSLGSGGAALTTRDEHEHFRSPTVPIRSKVGAGDSTVGGIVLALSRGASLPDAVCFGIAAGAAAVMTDGTELCRREDTERLYREMTESQRPVSPEGA